MKTLNSETAKALQQRWHGLDIRADGGYAVEWGRNAAGEYEVLRDLAALESLDRLPHQLLVDLGIAKNGAAPETPAEPDPQRKVRHPGRHAHLLGIGGAMRGRGESKAAILAELRSVNRSDCDPPKSEEEIVALAEDVVARYEPDHVDAVAELTELLKLGVANYRVGGARIVGKGSGASADLWIVEVDTGEATQITFKARRDVANAQRLNIEMSCFGVVAALKTPDAIRANVLLGQIAEHEDSDDDDDAAVDWGSSFLRDAELLDVDLSDQTQRWAAFSRLVHADPWTDTRDGSGSLAACSLVLRHPNGERWVRSSWFYGHVRRREGGVLSSVDVIDRMKRVGWTRRTGRGRVKATHPGDPHRTPILLSFYMVPPGWEDV